MDKSPAKVLQTTLSTVNKTYCVSFIYQADFEEEKQFVTGNDDAHWAFMLTFN